MSVKHIWRYYFVALVAFVALPSYATHPSSDEWPEYLPGYNNWQCEEAAYDESYYYCWESLWGFSHDFHVPAIEVYDAAGWGFDLYVPETGSEPNAHVDVLWEWSDVSMSATVGDADFEIIFDWACQWWYVDETYVGPPCVYWAQGIQLGDGWVLDNGLDLSGLYVPADHAFSGPKFAVGWGNWSAWYPYHPEPQSWEIYASWGHQTPWTDFQVEDFFGITVRVHHVEGHEEVELPEPGAATGLAVGIGALAALSRRRRRLC